MIVFTLSRDFYLRHSPAQLCSWCGRAQLDVLRFYADDDYSELLARAESCGGCHRRRGVDNRGDEVDAVVIAANRLGIFVDESFDRRIG